MLVQNAPVMAHAAAGDNLCEHHTEHTAECGYVAAVEGVACACEATDESGAVLHTGGCGYVAAVEGHECHFQCPECASNVGDGEPSEEPTEEPGDETPVCTCTVKCGEEGNADCEVCGVDYTKCTGTDTAADYAVVDTVTIYFQNNWAWSDVRICYWYSDGDGTAWPGEKMEHHGNDGTNDIYKYAVPADVTGIIINGKKDDGSGALDQTPYITGWDDGICYCMTWNNGNGVDTVVLREICKHTGSQYTTGTDNGYIVEAVTCSVCKTHEISRVKKDLLLADHIPVEAVEENRVESTCTKAGSYDEVVYCSVCRPTKSAA